MRITLSMLMLIAALAHAGDEEHEFSIGQRDQATLGLVSYWSMRNSGTTVFDEWGANNGTTSNSPTFSYGAGVVGNGMANSAAGLVVIANESVFDFGSGAFTLSAWVNKTNAADAMIVTKYLGVNGSRSFFWRFSTADQLVLFTSENGTALTSATSTGTVPLSQWQHVVVVKSSTTAKFYANGVDIGSGTATSAIFDSNVSLAIGAQINAASPLAGWIDEVRVYNRALSQDEIKQLYRMGEVIYANR